MAVMIKAKIYKILSDKGDKSYIGSTTKRWLSERWNGHKSDYRRKPIQCASKELFDEYGLENCRCELIEEVQCETKDDYLQRERYWIENTPSCINMRRKPIITHEEEINRRVEYQRIHYDEKKEDAEWMANRRRMMKEWEARHPKEIECECGLTYSIKHKARHLATERHLLRIKANKETPY